MLRLVLRRERTCVFVCLCPLSSLVRLWLSAMSERVRLAQIRDPVANAASRYAEIGSY